MDQKWGEAASAYAQLQEQLRNEQIIANMAVEQLKFIQNSANQNSNELAVVMATEQSKWQQQSDDLTHQLQM
eukprot:1805140-Karenia_brevis.AAC.1